MDNFNKKTEKKPEMDKIFAEGETVALNYFSPFVRDLKVKEFNYDELDRS